MKASEEARLRGAFLGYVLTEQAWLGVYLMALTAVEFPPDTPLSAVGMAAVYATLMMGRR